MKRKYLLYILVIVCSCNLNAQEFFGGGGSFDINIESSGSESNSSAENTVNGNGMDAPLMEASRFLSQATFGVGYDEIENVVDIGIESWIENQLQLPVKELTPEMWEIWEQIEEAHNNSFDRYLAGYIQEICYVYENDQTGTIPEPQPLTQQEVDDLEQFYYESLFGPSGLEFNFSWSHHVMTEQDHLRQRMAYALSQIMVISGQSDLGDHAESLTGFYDILQKQAFGNFKDLLFDVTLSPSMGFYLSHLNNPKAIPEQNIHPDENYAREIMQLFSIGLYELNLDGSRKKDSSGNDIPTYNNNDIKELARVFTGLGPGSLDPTMDIDWTDQAYFGLDLYAMNKTEPLVMYQEWHDEGSKSALNGLLIPAGMAGLDEIEMVVDYLFNHANVAPFICRQLIQRLIKSNPSPQYIERVARVFENNGSGVRGDLGAVLKAILLDEEARSCDSQLDPYHGKLNEPLLRVMRLMKSVPHIGYKQIMDIEFNDYSCSGIDTVNVQEEVVLDDLRYWNNGYNFFDEAKQFPLLSPTVFNFYLPDHQPVGEIGQLGLVAPEFKIHDSSTAVNYMNHVWMLSNPWYNLLWYNWFFDYGIESIMPDYEDWAELYNDEPEDLINHLDVVLTNGKLTDNTRNILRQFLDENPSWPEDISMARSLVYLILISPDYCIDK